MNNLNIEIRELDLKDAKNLFELIKILARETDNFPFTAEDYDLNEKQQKNFIEYLSVNENCFICGAFYQDKICGVAYLEGGRKNRIFHSCNLGVGVLKSYWGLGVGRRLIEKTLEYAYDSEYIAKIDIQVKSDNKSAISLYKFLGFNVEGRIRRALFIDGNFYDFLLMGKLID